MPVRQQARELIAAQSTRLLQKLAHFKRRLHLQQLLGCFA